MKCNFKLEIQIESNSSNGVFIYYSMQLSNSCAYRSDCEAVITSNCFDCRVFTKQEICLKAKKVFSGYSKRAKVDHITM